MDCADPQIDSLRLRPTVVVLLARLVVLLVVPGTSLVLLVVLLHVLTVRYRCRAKKFPAAKIFPPPWLYRLYYPLYVSRRIDTWQIVYLPNKDPCPKISIRKSEIKVH